MMNRTLIAGTVAVALLGTFPAYGAETTSPHFDAGVAAFRSGDYPRALKEFQLARQDGMTGSNLYYDLGVVNFKLGNYPAARKAFEQVASDPAMRALAHYNLALVARRMGDETAATDLLRQADNETSDPKLKELIARQQAPETTAKAEPPSKWFTSVSAGLGYNDNLIDPASLTKSTKGDSFAEASAFASGTLAGTYRDGVRLTLAGYLDRHHSLSAYDITYVSAGLTKSQPLGDWDTDLGVQVDQSRLGGKGYLRSAGLSATGQYRLDEDNRLRLRYRYTHYSSLSTAYNPLGGNRQRVSARIEHKLDEGRVSGGYEFESNNRDDLRSGTTFTSYSPTRHRFRVAAFLPLAEGWEFNGDLQYRVSRYKDADVFSNGTSTKRRDNRTLADMKVSYRLTKTWKAYGRYSYTNNNSNIHSYDYRQNIYSVGVTGLF